MTALEFLAANGTAPATLIARSIGVPVAEVYAQLVPAEAAGTVRVNVSHSGGRRFCEWESIAASHFQDDKAETRRRLAADPRFAAWAAGAEA